jgi:anti-sigma factor RsiW
MEEESSPERLLVASRVRQEKTPLEEMLGIRDQINISVEKLMTRSDKAVVSAQETQRATEEMFQRLQKYCDEKMPAQMVKILDAMAQEGFQKSLVTLDAKVAQAAQDIDRCRASLSHLSWNWRLLMGAAAVSLAVGLAGGAIGGGLVYSFFYSPKNIELHRLAWWGRNLDTRMGQTPSKDRERIQRWLNGGKL